MHETTSHEITTAEPSPPHEIAALKSTSLSDNTQVAWLTQEAYDRLKQELDDLVANRPVIAAKINDAREEGDLKDNGSYHAAREEQAQLEARIRQLQELLRVAKVGDPPESGVAAPGMVVTVRYQDDDETETFLLGPLEEVALGDLEDLEVYSPNSPLGKAIMGAREGEDRRYELPNGGLMAVAVVKAEPYALRANPARQGNPARQENPIRGENPTRPIAALQEDQRLESRTPSRQSLRTAPLSIYTSSDNFPAELVRAVHDLLVDCGIEIVQENPAQKGSWFKSWFIREKVPAALDKLAELLEKTERAGELKYIYAQRAQSDELEANAVATIINSLTGLDSAVIQLSSVIIVKSDGRVIARVLSEKELSVLREHPELLKSPRDILAMLPQLASKEVHDRALPPGSDVGGLVTCNQDGNPNELTNALTGNGAGLIQQTDADDDTSHDPMEVAARHRQND